MSIPSQPPAGTPPAATEPPASVATVKKTAPGSAAKPPSTVALEKKVAVLEDDLTGLKGWRDEINAFLADVGLGSGKTPPPKPTAPAAGLPEAKPPVKKGVLEDVYDTIFGEA